MRLVRHNDPQAKLPPPKHVKVVERKPQPMSRAELWETVEDLSRVLSEMHRRGVTSDLVAKVDLCRSIVLALYSTAPEEPGHSVKIRVLSDD